MTEARPLAALLARPSRSQKQIVQMRDVCKSYRGARDLALHPTTLEIAEGEFFSLLGPSGSGKTTTLRLIGGFERPDSGQILLDGVDVTDAPPNRRDVNTVFQNYALFPHMSVEQNVSYPLEAKGASGPEVIRRVGEALELVEMGSFVNRLPHELSGGQRQRVALARALVGRPKVLLLDEPLGALDLRLRHQMQSVLTHLQREIGITFIFVTHDHGEALAMSDRIAVMANGRIRQIGSPRTLYYRPENRFVAAFLGNASVLDGRVSPDGMHFETADIRLALGSRAKPGPAAATFRSEAVEIGVDPAAALPNTLAAYLCEIVFQGEITELSLRVGDTVVLARVPSRSTLGLEPGHSLTLRIDPQSIVVLHE